MRETGRERGGRHEDNERLKERQSGGREAEREKVGEKGSETD